MKQNTGTLLSLGFGLWVAGLSAVEAQSWGARRVSPLTEVVSGQELKDLTRQEESLFESIKPLVNASSPSVVAIRDEGNRWRAMGTVVAEKRVLTKASELPRGTIFVQGEGEKIYVASVVKLSSEHDLALLEVPELKAPVLPMVADRALQVGDFLVGVGMNRAALGFGVVGVAERSLRQQDQPYLGILADASDEKAGLRIGAVPGMPAKQAGIEVGDSLVSIEGKRVTGLFELRKILLNYKPGDEVAVELLRANAPVLTKLRLGERPEVEERPSARLEQMNHLGGNEMSRRRSGFPAVVQTDMRIKPEHTGAPVVDLRGQPIGILIARAGRIESYLIPARVIRDFLAQAE